MEKVIQCSVHTHSHRYCIAYAHKCLRCATELIKKNKSTAERERMSETGRKIETKLYAKTRSARRQWNNLNQSPAMREWNSEQTEKIESIAKTFYWFLRRVANVILHVNVVVPNGNGAFCEMKCFRAEYTEPLKNWLIEFYFKSS